MICPKCKAKLKKVEVKVQGAKNKAVSYQCPKCDYFEFDPASSKKVVEELRDTTLKIKQKVVKLSGDRLGIYLNSHVVRSLGIKKGENIFSWSSSGIPQPSSAIVISTRFPVTLDWTDRCPPYSIASMEFLTRFKKTCFSLNLSPLILTGSFSFLNSALILFR